MGELGDWRPTLPSRVPGHETVGLWPACPVPQRGPRPPLPGPQEMAWPLAARASDSGFPSGPFPLSGCFALNSQSCLPLPSISTPSPTPEWSRTDTNDVPGPRGVVPAPSLKPRTEREASLRSAPCCPRRGAPPLPRGSPCPGKSIPRLPNSQCPARPLPNKKQSPGQPPTADRRREQELDPQHPLFIEA